MSVGVLDLVIEKLCISPLSSKISSRVRNVSIIIAGKIVFSCKLFSQLALVFTPLPNVDPVLVSD